jgi:hypothetical protein
MRSSPRPQKNQPPAKFPIACRLTFSYNCVMANHPPATPLSALLADMRSESARLGASAGVLAAVQAMIAACLVRLLTRLDDMFTLWQAGRLPATAPSRARHPAEPAPRHSRHAAAKATGTNLRAPSRVRAPSPATRGRVGEGVAEPLQRRAPRPTPSTGQHCVRRPARGPTTATIASAPRFLHPPDGPKNGPRTPSPTHADFVTKSK